MDQALKQKYGILALKDGGWELLTYNRIAYMFNGGDARTAAMKYLQGLEDPDAICAVVPLEDDGTFVDPSECFYLDGNKLKRMVLG